MLGTDDEVTYQFFKGSSVQVILCPRSGGKGHSIIKQQVFYMLLSGLHQCVIILFQSWAILQWYIGCLYFPWSFYLYSANCLPPDLFLCFYYGQEAGAIYTHHQKSVIVDADAGHNMRKIIAFVGGLDLCPGRYDTPEHSLFRTLQTVHKDDFHQPNFTVIILFNSTSTIWST